jgi:hypothetical protein
MKIIFSLMFIALFSVLSAASSVIGLVQKVDGSVKLKSEGSFKKSKLKKDYEIKSGDLISSSKKGSAVLKLVDGSSIVLDSSSTIHFKTPKDAEQTEGKVYYKITSRDAKNSLKIKTPFAIIGIKGTTFIVDASKKGSVKLQEGLIGIKSLKEDFKLYRKALKAEYDKYKSEQESAFQKYKASQKKAAAQITKEFDLQAGNTISFSNNEVEEKGFSKEDEAEFERFKSMMQ